MNLSAIHTGENISNELNVAHELLGDLQALATQAATSLGDKLKGKASQEAIVTLRAQFEVAQEHFTELCGQAKEKASKGIDVADEAVRKNPYQTAVLALGIGMVVGIILGRFSK